MYAIILAGGEGRRLRPLTNLIPKPMVDIGGVPLLERQILQLKEGGVTDVIICEYYLADVIQEYFGDGSVWGIRIKHHVDSDIHVGSAGALKTALSMIPAQKQGEDIVMMYGDILSGVDIRDMAEKHRESGRPPVTVLGIPYRVPYGIMRTTKEGIITAFEEKPETLINGSIYVLNVKGMFGMLPERGDFARSVLEPLAGRIRVYPYDGYWRDVGTLEDLEAARVHVEGSAFRAEGPHGGGKERGF